MTTPSSATVDPALGAEWREAAAEAIESCLAAGLVAAAFDGERSRYVFVEREEVRRDPGPRGRAPAGRAPARPAVPDELRRDDRRRSACWLASRPPDAEGWGECVAGAEPDFSEEWNEGAWLVLRDFLVPALLAAGDVGVEDLERVFAFVRGHPMAKATLVNAFLDAELRAEGASARRRTSAPSAHVSNAASPSGSRPPPKSCSSRWTATSPRGTGGSS